MTDQCEKFGTLKLFHKKLQNTEKGEKKGKKLKQKNREDLRGIRVQLINHSLSFIKSKEKIICFCIFCMCMYIFFYKKSINLLL